MRRVPVHGGIGGEATEGGHAVLRVIYIKVGMRSPSEGERWFDATFSKCRIQ